MNKNIFLSILLLFSVFAVKANTPEPIVTTINSASRLSSVYVNPYFSRGGARNSVAPTTTRRIATNVRPSSSDRRYNYASATGARDSAAPTTTRRIATNVRSSSSDRRYNYASATGARDSAAPTTTRRIATNVRSSSSDRRYNYASATGARNSAAPTTTRRIATNVRPSSSDRRYNFASTRTNYASSNHARINDLQVQDVEAGEITMHPMRYPPQNPEAGMYYYNKSGAFCVYIVDEATGEAYWQKIAGPEHSFCDY